MRRASAGFFGLGGGAIIGRNCTEEIVLHLVIHCEI